ncbi:MAG: hypothetical protein ONB23_07995 [candidate division KSB1 bacterium]|nr:hypothetical protein [candidate division KSB1 bacterium]
MRDRIAGGAAVGFLLLMLPMLQAAPTPSRSVFQHFVVARGDRLMDGDQPLRFVSFNIPNLLLIEDDMAFTRTNPWRLPVEYEIEDALRTVLQAGGTVARTYTISVARTDDDPGTPKHVLGPGKFNEEAFRAMDQVLAVANRVGVRLIIPLVDNWRWMGGRPQYAEFRGKAPDQFWTDPQLRQDFRQTIAFVLNRVNTVTGVRYRDDKAILAWELGNELRDCPCPWAEEMAGFIKELDPNHLVADGVQSHELVEWALESPVIDLVSTHHYEGDPIRMVANIRAASERARGKKPYYVGEFGFLTEGGIRYVLDFVVQTPSIAGALIWSLRFHNRDGGFYWHSEPAGNRLYRAYHWPGFESGNPYAEARVLRLLQHVAFLVRGAVPPPPQAPDPPHLLPIDDVGRISWQGSVGAHAYVVERAESPSGPWQTVGHWVDDASVSCVPLFSDETAKVGKSYFYRIRAIGEGGTSAPSNVEGPVKTTHLTLVDELADLQRIFQVGGKLQLEVFDCRLYKEDLHRAAMEAGSWIRYWVPGEVRAVRVHAFCEADSLPLRIHVSPDGQQYRPTVLSVTRLPMNTRDYPYRTPVQVETAVQEGGQHFVEVKATGSVQLGRVEIRYE